MLSEGQRDFLDRIYDKYARTLFRGSLSLLRFLPDAPALAEECVQETFETALRKIAVLELHPSPEAWLAAVCRRITLSRRRKILNRLRITGRPVPCADSLADVRSRVDEWIDRHDLQQKKQQLLQTLTVEELAVYRVYFEEELSAKECAEKLGLSAGAVRGSVQRIRAKAAGIAVSLLLFMGRFSP